MSATWYGKTSNKQLEAMIDRKCTLRELFNFQDFMNEIKTHNTKLLDYLTFNLSLFDQLVEYVIKPPAPYDSDERKYKLPLMSVEIVETETACILNNFFKQIPNSPKLTYLQSLFRILDYPDILPLLSGYFFRINLCLMNSRQKQTIQTIYSNPQLFFKLIQHSQHMAIANLIQLYLNLDINKYQSIQTQGRIKVKIQMITHILKKIQLEQKLKGEKSCIIISNLLVVLCQTIEKYYLIIDGKQMIDQLTSEKSISLLMSLVRSAQTQYAFPAFSFFISMINYYSFSSLNADEISSECGKKNIERIDSQPMLIQLVSYFPNAFQRIMRANTINLYLYRLLEILCHCISISSVKIFQCIKKVNFFGCLINLIFKHQNNNILHMLIEKSFVHIFINDRKIYHQYKKYLFCEVDIIELTVGVFEKMLGVENIFEKGRKKPYFGHFMRILRIYSNIKTVDDSIVNAIESKSELWNRITKNLINPYESLGEKKLGSYQNVPEPKYQEFIVNNQIKTEIQPLRASTIEQIKNYEKVPSSQNIFEGISRLPPTKMPSQSLHTDRIEDPFQKSAIEADRKLEENHRLQKSTQNITENSTGDDNDKQLKKSQSFKDFMSKKKAEATREIKLQRSLSQERKLSGQKMRISNPSPNKKKRWQDQTQQQSSTQKSQEVQTPPPIKNTPKIPLANKKSSHQPQQQNIQNNNTHNNSMERRVNTTPDQSSLQHLSNRSIVNMAELKKIKVYQIEKPAEKKYRKVQEKDKLLLDFLGLAM